MMVPIQLVTDRWIEDEPGLTDCREFHEPVFVVGWVTSTRNE